MVKLTDYYCQIKLMKGIRSMDKIYEILEELRPEFDFKSSEDFIEDGYLDSFDVISLISIFEERFDISIDGLDLIPENFVNIDTIVALLSKYNVEL